MRLYGKWQHKVRKRLAWQRASQPRTYAVSVMGVTLTAPARIILPPRGAALREARMGPNGRVTARKPQIVLVKIKRQPGVKTTYIYAWSPPPDQLTLPKPHSVGARICARGKLSATVLDYERFWRTPGTGKAPRCKPKRHHWLGHKAFARGGAWRPSQLRDDSPLRTNRKGRSR